MSANSVVVIGGGFTGCMTALRLVQAGHEVTLYETQPHLGGTLRDLEVSGEPNQRRFLRGCQYADADAPWRAAIAPIVDAHLKEVPHTMASVTRHGARVHVSHDAAVPMLGGALPVAAHDRTRELSEVASATLANRLSPYGEWATWLTRYAERSGHAASTLAARAALGMQLSRVVAADVPAPDVVACKDRSPWADAHLAVPRSARAVAPLSALVPRDGWTPFFDALHQFLVRQGVVVHLGVQARVRGEPSDIASAIVVEAPACPAAAVYVWAGSPVSLEKAFRDAAPNTNATRLDNISVSAVHVHTDVAHWTGPVPHYVQWFDAASPLFRLYVYRMGNRVQACFECKGPLAAAAMQVMMSDVAQQCTDMGYASGPSALRFTPVQTAPLRLYHLQTARDVERLAQFGEQLAAWQPHATSPVRAIVDGAWLSYGREHKLRDIARRLEERGLSVAW